jgi:[ribosomal protein S18]-alanine N-acetyltransferase
MFLNLRPYESADLLALYEIDKACYEPGIAYSRRELRWYLEQDGVDCVVAEAATQLIGFILSHREGARAHIITIDVLEAWRRKRVGTALLVEIERRIASHGARMIELETATTNEAGVAFWRKHGYRTVGLLKGYYLDRLDAYSMRKNLPCDLPSYSTHPGESN